jgi:hypothetical protein
MIDPPAPKPPHMGQINAKGWPEQTIDESDFIVRGLQQLGRPALERARRVCLKPHDAASPAWLARPERRP